MILPISKFKSQFKCTNRELIVLASNAKIKFLKGDLTILVYIEYRPTAVIKFLNNNLRMNLNKLYYKDGKVLSLSSTDLKRLRRAS